MDENKRKTAKTEENAVVNQNLETFQISTKLTKKTRFFSLMIYASERQIQKVIGSHIRSVRAFCYILHDKDKTGAHFHVLIRTHATWSLAQIIKWFKGLKDEKMELVNTLAEEIGDVDALEEYLTHSDEKSIAQGKHQYSRDEIKDFGLCDMKERKDCRDSSYEILLHVLSGKNPRELVRVYGRDFLYHYNCYYEVADLIRNEEGHKEARINSALELSGGKKVHYHQYDNPCETMEELYCEKEHI